MTYSLKSRLSLGLTIGLLIFFGLQWLMANYTITNVTRSYVISRLQHDIESIVLNVQIDSNGIPSLNAKGLNPVFNQIFSGHYYGLVVDDIRLYSRSLWSQEFKVKTLASGQQAQQDALGPQNQPLLVLVQGFTKQNHRVTVAVAEDLSLMNQQIQAFQRNYAAFSFLLLALLLLLQKWFIGASLKPLQGVQEDISALENGEISQLRTNIPREIQPVVHEFNHLITIMEKQLICTRHALSNLTHALKLPLTVLTQLIENSTSSDNKQPLLEQTERMNQLVERELKRARLAGKGIIRKKVDVNAEIAVLVEVLRQAYQSKQLDITFKSPPQAIYSLDREDLLELIGNILDNACKWALHHVAIEILNAPDLCCTIADDGPGCAPDDLEKLAQRGLRLDEAVSGHGFGLSIAKEIVALYEGQIDFQRSQTLGGLQVQIKIPQDHP